MTWTALTYSFGSQLTSSKMTQNQDNFTALANGDAGAPKVQTAGINDLAVTTAKLADNNVTTAKIANNQVTAPKLAAGTAEQDWVLARTSGAAYGAIGTYAFLAAVGANGMTEGATYAGSALYPAGIYFSGTIASDGGNTADMTRGGSVVSGTWRLMGRINNSSGSSYTRASLFLRIS